MSDLHKSVKMLKLPSGKGGGRGEAGEEEASIKLLLHVFQAGLLYLIILYVHILLSTFPKLKKKKRGGSTQNVFMFLLFFPFHRRRNGGFEKLNSFSKVKRSK